MSRKATIRSLMTMGAVVAVFITVAGCLHHGPRRACVYPHGAIPAKPGTYTCRWQATHAARARAEDLVIYEAEWIGESDRLGPAARKRLASLAKTGVDWSCPLIVEEADDADLNERRKLAVSAYLAQQGAEVPPEAVMVGHSQALGLFGQEADNVSRSMLRGGQGQTSREITPFGGFQGGFRGGMEGGFNSF